jgi:UDP-N-acetylmuramate--alanine ligase
MRHFLWDEIDGILNKIKENNQHIYIMGCGGISMTIIADHCLKNSYPVVGVDLDKNKVKSLDLYKNFFSHHHGDNIDDNTGALIISHFFYDNAYPEIIKAKSMDIPIIPRLDFINYLAQKIKNNNKLISVMGSSGKTTTTYFGFTLSKLLGQNPSIFGGSFLPIVGNNYYLGDGDVFLENCEARDEHLRIQGDVLIITSINKDHLEEKCYGNDYEKLQWSFIQQMNQSGQVIYYSDNGDLDALAAQSCKKWGVDLFAFSDVNPQAHCYLKNFTSNPLGSTATLIITKNNQRFSITLGVPFGGIKNFLNYSAIIFLLINEKNYKHIIDVSRFVYLAAERGTYCGTLGKTIIINNFAQVMDEFLGCAINYRSIFPQKKIIMAIEITRLARYNREIVAIASLLDHVDEIFMAPPWEKNQHIDPSHGDIMAMEGTQDNINDKIKIFKTIDAFRQSVDQFIVTNNHDAILICCNYTKPYGLKLMEQQWVNSY